MTNTAILGHCHFSKIYQQYSGRLSSYLNRQGLGSQDVEDVGQEVWIRIWRNLSRFDGGDFVPWMLRIAKNCIIDLLRKSKKSQLRLRIFAQKLLNANQQSPKTQVSTDELVVRLRSELDRECVFIEAVKSQLEGESVEATASRLNVSVNTVYTRRNRGRELLRQIMKIGLN